jgi:hypothetical protein
MDGFMASRATNWRTAHKPHFSFAKEWLRCQAEVAAQNPRPGWFQLIGKKSFAVGSAYVATSGAVNRSPTRKG